MPVEHLPDPFAPAIDAGRRMRDEAEAAKPAPPLADLSLFDFRRPAADADLAGPDRAFVARARAARRSGAAVAVRDDGHAIARRGAIKEAPVDVTRLNPQTPAAFVAIEDRRFYRHWGVDPRGIGRAMLANLRGGGVRQGGSTITQQLAKTNFLSGDRTIKRKAQEVIIAFWLEAWLTKQEILSRYLSSVYFGDGVYGLRAAAHHYFRRDPGNLNLAQSAMLAGMVQAPSRLAPTQQSRARPEAQPAGASGHGRHRRRSARRARVGHGWRGPSAQVAKIPTGTYFADWVTPYAQTAFSRRFRRGEGRDDARSRPSAARRPGRRPRRDRQGAGGAGGDAARWPGGGDGRRQELFGLAVQPGHPGAAPAGSAFKLFVYLAALRAGWTPDSMIED